jgi:hypothetical protein
MTTYFEGAPVASKFATAPDVPASNPIIEAKAQTFEKNLRVGEEAGGHSYAVDAKRVAEEFLEDTLKLPKAEQFALLTRVQDINDRERMKDPYLPEVQILFADYSNSGARRDLSRFALNLCEGFSKDTFAEHVELYDPPTRGK